MSPRIGSLFSGYGGLDLGVQAVLGGSVAWHVENDPAPARILDHHWPDVPNHGDITAVDWAAVEPVDILTGGFPCQDVSLAGLRRGLRPDTRSGLWSHYALAIAALRPSLVIVENVRGLLSAEAHSDLEPDPWGLGDRSARPALRALGAILGDLADLGYDASWIGLRASDAGAPHERFRVFLAAYPQRDELARERDEQPWRAAAARRGQGAAADAAHLRQPVPSAVGPLPQGAAGPSDHGTASDTQREQPERWRATSGVAAAPRAGEAARPERQRDGNAARDRDRPAANTTRGGQRAGVRQLLAGQPDADRRAAAHTAHDDSRRRAGTRAAGGGTWGQYAHAIARWETVIKREAPAPTEHGRLAPRFVEWMMGLPEGHVTSAGLRRAQQLRALGNGVVPQQAELAVRTLLARSGAS